MSKEKFLILRASLRFIGLSNEAIDKVTLLLSSMAFNQAKGTPKSQDIPCHCEPDRAKQSPLNQFILGCEFCLINRRLLRQAPPSLQRHFDVRHSPGKGRIHRNKKDCIIQLGDHDETIR